MKKLTLTLALIFALAMGSFAQGYINNLQEYEETGLFGRGLGLFRDGEKDPLFPQMPEEHDLDNDQNSSPLGSGIAVLIGLGAAYAVAKKREE